MRMSLLFLYCRSLLLKRMGFDTLDLMIDTGDQTDKGG